MSAEQAPLRLPKHPKRVLPQHSSEKTVIDNLRYLVSFLDGAIETSEKVIGILKAALDKVTEWLDMIPGQIPAFEFAHPSEVKTGPEDAIKWFEEAELALPAKVGARGHEMHQVGAPPSWVISVVLKLIMDAIDKIRKR
jgi:hypothetical protein